MESARPQLLTRCGRPLEMDLAIDDQGMSSLATQALYQGTDRDSGKQHREMQIREDCICIPALPAGSGQIKNFLNSYS